MVPLASGFGLAGVGRALCGLVLLTSLTGCAGLGRGVTEAVLEAASREGPDTRECDIEGQPFRGIEPALAQQDPLPPFGPDGIGDRPQPKLIYVHGIGTHLPGHGTALHSNISRFVGLDTRAPRAKRIVLTSPARPDEYIGELNITRLTNEARQRDLLFFEVTWSPITQPDKEILASDRDPFLVRRRAAINQTMRDFVNDIAPDPLAYNGNRREPILSAVSQSLCWAVSRSWSELPELTQGVACGPDLPGFGSRAAIDPFAFVTHSLGSRITMDALQRLTNVPITSDPRVRRVADHFKDREIQLFMLSNQLPLLESGRDPQAVTGQIEAYCGPGATSEGRFFGKTRIVAFNDPNDLMSFPISDQFATRYIDSRLCPEVTNITINVATVNSLLGLGEVANPLSAHVNYDGDERVGALLAHGAGHPGVHPLVAERCTWRQTDESLMR